MLDAVKAYCKESASIKGTASLNIMVASSFHPFDGFTSYIDGSGFLWEPKSVDVSVGSLQMGSLQRELGGLVDVGVISSSQDLRYREKGASFLEQQEKCPDREHL
ncbi:hypothetical protein N7481_000703 [Penicillium waksmanii]|uniref:uncharacterized protein n=1 Tax=Penicillium waksmanii TaxID=69791 RepID=UPI002546F63B|nr:uncharacterized protein N7481_000703 [Penicillium waksmanii]KAJ6000294.1 hypothetical protein N7481_000703 [Penicillium waksmanii]